MLSTMHNADVVNQLSAVDSVATLTANDRAHGGHVSLRTHRFPGKRPSSSFSGRSIISGIKRPSILPTHQPRLCSATSLRNQHGSEQWLMRPEAGYLPAAAWASLVIRRGRKPVGSMRPVARERRIETGVC